MPSNAAMIWLSNIWEWLTDTFSRRHRESAEGDERVARQQRVQAHHERHPPK
jgi:hypothetical protein